MSDYDEKLKEDGVLFVRVLAVPRLVFELNDGEFQTPPMRRAFRKLRSGMHPRDISEVDLLYDDSIRPGTLEAAMQEIAENWKLPTKEQPHSAPEG